MDMKRPNPPFKRRAVAAGVILAGLSLPAAAQQAQQAEQPSQAPVFDEIIVTGSRRAANVNDIPINISAVGGDTIEDLRLDGISKLAYHVPGLTVLDRGARDEVPDVLLRGLNTTQIGPGFGSDTVATYFSEIPMSLDIKPVDLQRVEVLKGPQGTLYGQGTMAGAIRYIPRLADMNEYSVSVRGGMGSSIESEDFNHAYGATLNLPFIEDILSLRLNLDHIYDPGFIDYPYVVRVPGVSNPEPDRSDPDEVAANLRSYDDANGEETVALRANIRLTPAYWMDANLWYFNQDTEAEGRQIAHRLAFGTGAYESGLRYLEPNDYNNEIVALEAKFDAYIAEATVVYGETNYEELGQRDQTDLLLDFEYGYEMFPSFSSFTREEVEQETETVEARLASTHDGPVSWVAGYFSYEVASNAVSEEYVPGFGQYAVDNLNGMQLRDDDLEYIQLTDFYEKETAFYGEVAYDFGTGLTGTLGYRQYDFETDITTGFGLPFYGTVFDGESQDYLGVDLGNNDGDDSGDLYKFNLAYETAFDGLFYFTYSEGYRNGGVNSVPECTAEQIASTDQQLCALQDEVHIKPDTIANYEVGYKGLLGERLSVTAALYWIDWDDLQVGSVTQNGSLNITVNGSTAVSRGLEFQGRWLLSDNADLTWSYAYTDAYLNEDSPGLVGDDDFGNFTVEKGARLPGHATHQGNVNLSYDTSVMGGYDLRLNYGILFASNIFNLAGGDEDPLFEPAANNAPGDFGGEAVPGYSVHHLSASIGRDDWTIQAYIDNVWDKYYITGTRSTRRLLQDEDNGPGRDINGFTLRSYGQFIGAPRNIGVRFTYDF